MLPLTTLLSLSTLARMSDSKWTAADLPSFDGRTVVITGANSGIGRGAATELARAGAHVVLAVRNTAKGRQAATSMPGATEVRELDLASLVSVHAFASAWDRDIDVLINNAGVMALPETRTADGFEMQFGTNHLGHFALTNLLLPSVRERVVNVASGAHRMGKIDFDDLNWRTRKYSRWPAYGQSKLANLLFTLELKKRLAAIDSGVRVTAAHPGWAATHLQGRTENPILDAPVGVLNKLLAQSADQGAWPTLYAASADLPSGTYIGPDGIAEMRGHPAVVGRSGRASNEADAARLWELSEQLTGVKWGLGVAAPA
jgi:NAD(P)-dependent dehydrogenase (short-subunit alcohol dehydrogenase family)